jgi:hypothetical protein
MRMDEIVEWIHKKKTPMSENEVARTLGIPFDDLYTPIQQALYSGWLMQLHGRLVPGKKLTYPITASLPPRDAPRSSLAQYSCVYDHVKDVLALLPKPEPKDTFSCYWLRAAGTNFIKIGRVSGTDVDSLVSRINDLQNANPYELRLAYVDWYEYNPVSTHLEKDMHRKFHGDRERREWFRFDPNILGFLLTRPGFIERFIQ